MKVSQRLQTLVDHGLIQEVGRAVQAGKEAEVYLVVADGQEYCAKVYKEANNRGFRNRAQYEEGRNVRNTRRGRAMQKGSKFGKSQLEEAWQNAEVDALYRLAEAGVRVPKPLAFVEGILVMELIADSSGQPAPRLAALDLDSELAEALHQLILHQVVGMLCAGLVHADLSEYNILVTAEGPVIIDLPQAVDAAGNNSARRLLLRDVDNVTSYLSTYNSGLAGTDYGREIWDLYEQGLLVPNTPLTGRYKAKTHSANVGGVLKDIGDAREQAERQGRTERRKRRGDHGRARPAAAVVAEPIVDEWSGPATAGAERSGGRGDGGPRGAGARREPRPQSGGGTRGADGGRLGPPPGGPRGGGHDGRGRPQPPGVPRAGGGAAGHAARPEAPRHSPPGAGAPDDLAPPKKRRRRRRRGGDGSESGAPRTGLGPVDGSGRGAGSAPRSASAAQPRADGRPQQRGGEGQQRGGEGQQRGGEGQPRGGEGQPRGGAQRATNGGGASASPSADPGGPPAPRRRRRRRRSGGGGGG